jgi:hypothetical protein
MKLHQLKDFQKMFIDMIALQSPEQYKLHSSIIGKQTEQRLKKKIEKYPLYLINILGQLYSNRPKRFTENVWNITKILRQKLESIYSSEMRTVKILLYQLILNQIKK